MILHQHAPTPTYPQTNQNSLTSRSDAVDEIGQFLRKKVVQQSLNAWNKNICQQNTNILSWCIDTCIIASSIWHECKSLQTLPACCSADQPWLWVTKPVPETSMRSIHTSACRSQHWRISIRKPKSHLGGKPNMAFFWLPETPLPKP